MSKAYIQTLSDGAQDMGLGKTLSSLALVCNSLDRHQKTTLAGVPKGTLIVTPMSSMVPPALSSSNLQRKHG